MELFGGGAFRVLKVPQSDGEHRLGDVACIWGTFRGSSCSPSPCSPAAMFSEVTPPPGHTLLGPPSAEPPTFARAGSNFADRSQPFRLGERSFGRQYAHLYATRLLCMRPRLEQQARLRWGERPPAPQSLAAPRFCLLPGGTPTCCSIVPRRAAYFWDCFSFWNAQLPPRHTERGLELLGSAHRFLPPGSRIPGVAGAVPSPHLPPLIPSQCQTLTRSVCGTGALLTLVLPTPKPSGVTKPGGTPQTRGHPSMAAFPALKQDEGFAPEALKLRGGVLGSSRSVVEGGSDGCRLSRAAPQVMACCCGSCASCRQASGAAWWGLSSRPCGCSPPSCRRSTRR